MKPKEMMDGYEKFFNEYGKNPNNTKETCANYCDYGRNGRVTTAS